MRSALGSIERLRALWQDETSPAARRGVWAAAGAGLIAAALTGRIGTDWSRAAAAAIVVVALVPAIGLWMSSRRRARDPRAVMRATVLRTQPDLARAALRALALQEKTEADPDRGSLELAQYHFHKVLGRASLERIVNRAARHAWLVTATAFAIGAAALGAVAFDPFRVLEGLDVLAARDGVAPVPMRWVELSRFVVEPPAYLQLGRRPIRPHHPTTLHVGTTITVNAVPIHDARELVLTNGELEVPFRDDGEGALVARWTVIEDTELTVAARFGDVLVPEPLELRVDSIADHAPYVMLEGAPGTKRLLDHPRIPIHWEASDDHGLREVALVLRAGEREIRRELSNKQGSGAVDKGGIELRADDPFLDKSYLPVEVTVQALDNDPVTGPKWGKSAALILLPPQIGEREAMRYAALAAGRDAMTDLLAERLAHGDDGRARLARERPSQAAAMSALRRVLDGEWGGLRFRGRLAALARGQMELLDKDFDAWTRSPTKATRDKLVARTEDVLLALDSALGALGFRDTRASSLKLAEVAADAATAIEQSRDPAASDRALLRFDADLGVLDRSAAHLMAMGSLGRDIGEIVENGLRRIRRAYDAGDRYHARLAAEDLAARLRQPDPSFGAAGGGGGQGRGGGKGGVESGHGHGPASQGESSQAAEDAAEVERALEQLRQEHAAEMSEVDKALQDAMSPEMKQALDEAMRDAAKEVREAVSDLPRDAAQPDSSRADAARGRSEAEAAAAALEKGEIGQAMQRGKQALDALRQAERKASQASNGTPEQQMGQAAGDAANKLQDIMKRAEQARGQARGKASEGAGERLERSAIRERELAERARQIRQQSESGEAPLPSEQLQRLEEAARAMEEAAGQLDGAKGERAQDKQREAQRLLEMSQPERDDEPPESERHGEGDEFARDADVPGENRDERADAFRKRVTDGLGKDAPPHLRDAIKRYTEGLLR